MTKGNAPLDGRHDFENEHQDLVRALAGLEEAPPPPGFTARVMAALPRNKPGLRVRFWRWATAPRTLTLVPARLAPVALGLILALAGLAVMLAPHGHEPDDHLVAVRFVLPDPGGDVHSVAVIGSFNHWEPGDFQMRYDAAARAWVLEARVPPGSHEYGFLINGRQVVPDPDADLQLDDGFGNRNSVLLVNGHAI